MITGKDLIDRGWKSGPLLGAALKRAKELSELGLTDDLILHELGSAPVAPDLLRMREIPCEMVRYALKPDMDNPDEVSNFNKVDELMRHLLQVPVVRRASVMPDACPAGSSPATITVGGAIEVEDAIIPSAHSSDICCSMMATFYPMPANLDVKATMDSLVSVTHFGIGGRPVENWLTHPILSSSMLDSNPFLGDLRHQATAFLGTQGDGNHFAYLGRMKATPGSNATLEHFGYDAFIEGQEYLTLVTHHGSRSLGAKVYKRGQEVATRMTNVIARDIPKAAHWIPYSSQEGSDYWNALGYVRRWTEANHQVIHQLFRRAIDAHPTRVVFNEHNFVWKRGAMFLHGKGATPAWVGPDGRNLLGLIPLNMAEPILLTVGGNSPGKESGEHLGFSPHGAGRNYSRTQIIRTAAERARVGHEAAGRSVCESGYVLAPHEVRDLVDQQTRGLDIRWYSGKPDLAESPMGYKPAKTVIGQIREFGLATIAAEIEPLGCIMAGEQPLQPWQAPQKPKPAKYVG